MTTKKKAIIGVCVGAGVLIIVFLIYFFFIRFSIVGKWKKVETYISFACHIDSIEFQSNGDAYIYSDRSPSGMIKGHYSLSGDNKDLSIYFDKSERVVAGFYIGDPASQAKDGSPNLYQEKIHFEITEYSNSKIVLLPDYGDSNLTNTFEFTKD